MGPAGDRPPVGVHGRRRAHFHRGGAPRPAPGRLGRPVGKVARGAPSSSPSLLSGGGGGGPRRAHRPECYSPPAAALAESRGRGSETCRRALPPPGAPPRGRASPPGGVSLAGARRVFLGGGRAAPPTARPLSHPGLASSSPPSRGVGRATVRVGAGRTVLSAPRAGRAVGPGGLVFLVLGHAVTSEASARGQRRCRPPTRPVLKHGPRSLTRARVRGSHESRRGAMKVKAAARRRPRWDPEASPSPPRAHHRPVSPAAPGRWSMSARVRTRKMVNYAWAGRSQRKLWWRSVAVLTCKSVVRPGYRGERLIEPSSSWFPPKFPSG